jgi:hypothetical protein
MKSISVIFEGTAQDSERVILLGGKKFIASGELPIRRVDGYPGPRSGEAFDFRPSRVHFFQFPLQ